MKVLSSAVRTHPCDQIKDRRPVDLFPEIRSLGSSEGDLPGAPFGGERLSHLGSNLKNPKRITISRGDWASLVRTEENISLVGRFMKERPPLDALRSTIKAALKPEGDLQIGSLNQRSILLRFSSEVECRRAWLRNRLVVDGNSLWISRWRPEHHLEPFRDSPFTLVWFQLPFLPLHLFTQEMLSCICAPIGRVVALDSATIRRTRPNVAKVRIEIDVSKPILDKIWIEIGKGGDSIGFWQKVEAEQVPRYCPVCGRFGHGLENCRRRTGEFNEERAPPVRQNARMGLQTEVQPLKTTQNGPDEGPLMGGTSKGAAKPGTPGVCRYAPKGLSLSEQERIVQEAILEAAENIMEEVADKVVREGCSKPRWADLMETDDQNGTSGKAEMQMPMKDSGLKEGNEVDDRSSEKAGNKSSGYDLKQGSEASGIPRVASSAEGSNRSSSGQGKGLSKNQIRREKRKQSMARIAEKKRGENLENSQVSSGLLEPLMELEVWIDKVKEGVSKEEAEVFEEARSEVLQFFKHAQLELGKERFHEREDDLVQKAKKVFLDKLGNIQGNFRSLVEEMGSPMKGRKELSGPDKSGSPTQSLESSGSSTNQDNNHRSFVVKKNEWEEAKIEIAAHMSKLKKELGMQEFERRKEEIVEKTKALYLDKLKELSKAHM